MDTSPSPSPKRAWVGTAERVKRTFYEISVSRVLLLRRAVRSQAGMHWHRAECATHSTSIAAESAAVIDRSRKRSR
eukprot:6203551-Pleurochrysis_carterae.AAC.1